MGIRSFVSRRAPLKASGASADQYIHVFDTATDVVNGHATGDLALFVYTGELKRWDGSAWRRTDGGLSGQTTITDNTATSLFTATLATSDTAWGAILDYAVFYANSSHVVQLEVGSVPVGAINENGTVSAVVGGIRALAGEVTAVPGQAITIAADVGGGTNAVTFTGTQATTVATFKVTADTSLTPAAGKAFIVWTVRPLNGNTTPTATVAAV